MRKRIFTIQNLATDSSPIVYNTIKALYEENKDQIGVTIGALMNAVCKYSSWENDRVKVARHYIIPAIRDNGEYIELKL